MKRIKIFILGIIFLLVSTSSVTACTGFTESNDGLVLVGSNEDNISSRRYVEIHPPEEGLYGKIYFIYDGYGMQQAINDQGLLYDGFWAPHLDILEGEGKPQPNSWIGEWLEVCSTVNEVIDIYNNYDWRDTVIEDAMLFFVDKQGNSAIIEGDEIIYKEGDFQVVTNFYQSHPELGGYGFDRYNIAFNMLENMNDLSMEYFRDICDATHTEWTIYSLVCDLSHNKINYYYDHNYNELWEINLSEEFEFGEHSYDVLNVFNNNKPNKPNRPNGERNGSVNTSYEYSCKALDVDSDNIYYKWDWGDGTISNWIGPLDHDETCIQSHQWSKKGEYQIKVMARDINGGKSDWSNPLIVSIPKYKNIQRFFILFLDFLEEHPRLFPLLRQILKI